jgi:vitamin B12 transporter
MKKTTLSLVLATLLSANETLDIPTVYITSAIKSKQKLEQTTATTHVITKEVIQERHFTSATEALNSLVGLSFTQNGGIGSASAIRLRGFDTKRLLILVDGMRMNDVTGLNGAYLEHILVSDIEQIEVIKGGQSAIWGEDATSGVINIITTKSKKGTAVHGYVEAGSYATKKIGASLHSQDERSRLQLNVGRVASDSFSSAVPRNHDVDDYEHDEYRNLTMNMGYTYFLAKGGEFQLQHMIMDIKQDSDSSASQPNSKNDTLIKQQFSKIGFSLPLQSVLFNTYASRSTFDRDYPQGYTKEFDGVVSEYGADVIHHYNSGNIRLGMEYKRFEHLNSINRMYRAKAWSLTNQYAMFDDTLHFTQAIRSAYYDQFENKRSYQVGVKYLAPNNTFLGLSVATAYNVPTMYYLYDSYAGNSALTPEETKGFELITGFDNVTLSYFYNEIKDKIDYDSGVNKFINLTGISKIEGVEVAYNHTFDEALVELNYTYLYAQDNEGFDLERRPKETLKLSYDYYGIENTHVNVNAEYIGDRIEYSYGTHTIDAQTGNYTLVNAVANYDISDTLSTYLKIDNLTNKFYQTVDGYGTSERAFYVGINATF